VFGYSQVSSNHGGLVRDAADDIPHAMKVGGWLGAVRREISIVLQGLPLEYDQHRHLIQFNDDMVFDFEQDKAVLGQPRFGITKYLPFDYAECEWPADIRAGYLAAIADIVSHITRPGANV
jgi:hypothetical protein